MNSRLPPHSVVLSELGAALEEGEEGPSLELPLPPSTWEKPFKLSRVCGRDEGGLWEGGAPGGPAAPSHPGHAPQTGQGTRGAWIPHPHLASGLIWRATLRHLRARKGHQDGSWEAEEEEGEAQQRSLEVSPGPNPLLCPAAPHST